MELQPLTDFELPELPVLPVKPKIPPKPKHLKLKSSTKQPVQAKPIIPPKPKDLVLKGSTRYQRPKTRILHLSKESKSFQKYITRSLPEVFQSLSFVSFNRTSIRPSVQYNITLFSGNFSLSFGRCYF